ncbi:hypothetical protein B0H66DRAFT_537267 [Apodospora peruviana]|uniref:DUF1996 domain-containing protein n=1 Tax=Apodospora peruviana TaxID=516989 RepID=A0AAE0HXW6_9PEZI|nr:hypothetical protein B0H66DRAFT_539072 [Apodospora peruviana]KAK3314016.1 hypothetical protein B0H66DRAFT_537267 [Apodospora peruviana]
MVPNAFPRTVGFLSPVGQQPLGMARLVQPPYVHYARYYSSNVTSKKVDFWEPMNRTLGNGLVNAVSEQIKDEGTRAGTDKLPTGNFSVDWAPTLYHVDRDNYTEVNPVMLSTGYENIDKAEIPFSQDCYAVAGNASAKNQADVNTEITWWCENGPEDINSRPRAALPTVTCSTHIQAILRLPDCVNTANIKKEIWLLGRKRGQVPN